MAPGLGVPYYSHNRASADCRGFSAIIRFLAHTENFAFIILNVSCELPAGDSATM